MGAAAGCRHPLDQGETRHRRADLIAARVPHHRVRAGRRRLGAVPRQAVAGVERGRGRGRVPVHDRRRVRSSSGHVQDRFVVLMTMVLVGREVLAEVTLTRPRPDGLPDAHRSGGVAARLRCDLGHVVSRREVRRRRLVAAIAAERGSALRNRRCRAPRLTRFSGSDWRWTDYPLEALLNLKSAFFAGERNGAHTRTAFSRLDAVPASGEDAPWPASTTTSPRYSARPRSCG